MRRKRITRIYNKIMQIVTKGSDANIEYYNYIDDSIANGEYSLLEDVFSTCFNTDILLYPSIDVFKKKSFKKVQTYTYSYFQINLKGFYDMNDVYQIGKQIFETSTNFLLGDFTEKDKLGEVSYQGATYSYNQENIYYKNTELFHKKSITEASEMKIVDLIVYIEETGKRFLLGDPTMELIDKYKYGISLLKNGNINQYVDIDYVYNYYI